MIGSIASSITGIAIAGPIAGAIFGALVSLFLAWLGIRYKVDQIIAGTVINIGALGVTTFAYLRILQPYSEFNRPTGITPIQIPFLSDIPVIGPILFSLSPYFYIAVGLVLFFTYMIYRTRWGCVCERQASSRTLRGQLELTSSSCATAQCWSLASLQASPAATSR